MARYVPTRIAVVGKALGVIEANAVNLEFLKPIRVDAVHEILGRNRQMVKIVSPTVRRVGTVHIEPGIVARGLALGSVPVHLHERALAISMVEDHVHNDRDTPAMATVDKLLVLFGRAVVLVERHVEGGIVAPAFVVFELIVGHEFDGVDAQTLQIVQRIQNHLVIALAAEVTHQQFVDAQIGAIRGLEGGVLPRVFGLSRLQQGAMPCRQAGGIAGQIGPGSGGYIPIVVGVQNQLRIGVRHFNQPVDPVLVGIGLARLKIKNQPKLLPIHRLVHVVGGIGQVAVKVPQDIHKVLIGRVQLEQNSRVV